MTGNITLEDKGRRSLDLNSSKVIEVLPEYFLEDNPNLIALLDAYMEFMDSDGGVNDKLKGVLKARDIGSVSLDFLDYILDETGLGMSHDKLADPRVIAQNFPDFFRYKGSLYSAKAFFRMLYGEEAEITYPKDQLFIVGQSHIGPESLRFIQNGALYQTLSILIKSSQPISEWRDLYKQYVHPAGFYLGSEVLSETVIDLGISEMPEVIPDPFANEISLSPVANITVFAETDPLTSVIVNGSGRFRINMQKDMDNHSLDSMDGISNQYTSISDMVSVNAAPTFADSSSRTWSNTIERFDQSIFNGDGDSASNDMIAEIPTGAIYYNGEYLIYDGEYVLAPEYLIKFGDDHVVYNGDWIIPSERILGITEDTIITHNGAWVLAPE